MFYSKAQWLKHHSAEVINVLAEISTNIFLVFDLTIGVSFQCLCKTLFRKKGTTPVFSTIVAFNVYNISFPSSFLQDCGRDQFQMRVAHDHYHRKQYLSTDKSYETMMKFL